MLEQLGRWQAKHAGVLLAFAAVATIILVFGLGRLEFSTGQDTLLSPGSDVYKDNLRYQEAFGGDPIILLLEGDVMSLFGEPNRSRLRAFESEILAMADVHSVVSPLTVVDLGVVQAEKQQAAAVQELARSQEAAAAEARRAGMAAGADAATIESAESAARAAALAAFIEARAADLARFQAIGEVSAANPRFAEFVLFGEDGRPRPEASGVLPGELHALVVVRIGGNLPFDRQSEVAEAVRQAALALRLEELSVLASGPALLIKEINDSMRSTLVVLGGVSVLVMVAVLALVFRASWRLLSLPVVLASCVWLFGSLGYAASSLTLVTISALPILIGLGVDFAIQVHNRYEEESSREVAGATLARIGPTLFVALAAAIAGFSALLLSDVPMIRDFSIMLAVGATLVLLGALIIMPAALALLSRSQQADLRPPAAVDGALKALSRGARPHAGPLVLVGLLVLALGIWADQRLSVETDPERFVSQDSVVLRELQAIRSITGSTSELGLIVEAPDVLEPDVLAWMQAFVERQTVAYPQLRSGSSAATLFAGTLGRLPESADEARAVLAIAPESLRRTLVTEDRRRANIVFSIGDMSLAERQALVASMNQGVDAPPGTTVSAGGIAVVGAATVDALASNRTTMSVVAVGAVFLVLLLTQRSLVFAAAVLLPVVVALGLSASFLYAGGITLNPLTAVSGPLVIAMGTEFSILIAWRYREERGSSSDAEAALSRTMDRIGGAVLASGLTVIGGFAALAFADFPLLRDFGIVTAANIGISLVSVLVVLPAVLLWLDREPSARARPSEAASGG